MFKKGRNERSLFKEAGNWLRLAERIHDYRRDQMTTGEVDNLRSEVGNLQEAISSKSVEKIEPAVQGLEKHLRRSGGCLYPRTSWAENVEMLLVAAILAIGIRTFFFQPFKIPTNSMYPSYNGLTYAIFAEGEEPILLHRVFRTIAFGASRRELVAPADGEVLVPIFSVSKNNAIKTLFPTERTPGRKWFLLKTTLKKATLYIGDKTASVKVPLDFNFDKVLRERFFPESPETTRLYEFERWLKSRVQEGKVVRRKDQILLKTGQTFRKGDTILSFDILTGDALFVDRVSFHFVSPEIGDPFVFRTRNVEGITKQNLGVPTDKYYIKRLVGKGGDSLAIRDSTLYRNGKPIEGADPFQWNSEKVGDYQGYTHRQRLGKGNTDTVPPKSFYAMGDNSDESSDSRIWGFVPDTEVVGRALFIYYPFTKHWGRAF